MGIDDIFQKVKQSSSNLSLNRSSNSLKPSSPQPPRKPERSFIEPGPTLELAVMNKFNGKTREDLIKLVVLQQSTIDMQGKKITDLESYIDGLVSSVIEVAPVLLHKDVKTS